MWDKYMLIPKEDLMRISEELMKSLIEAGYIQEYDFDSVERHIAITLDQTYRAGLKHGQEKNKLSD